MISTMYCVRGMVTVFVNNLSARMHWRWLWKLFQYHGRVVDVFILSRKSRSGKKYDFIGYAFFHDT
ncbi:hypothetical protein Goari_019093 [Gossypium aridum]|uniref:RRM domain-containing protein n=1 Tax=Gossypium aridum TaxID=34290 RepID=A0A7J8WSZ8_GOSAI|nr:hypothetical protein [Gossypium aridum]